MAACCCATSACRPMSVLMNAPVMSAGTAIVSASIPNHLGVASTASNVGRGDQITPRVRCRRPGSDGLSKSYGDVIVSSRLGVLPRKIPFWDSFSAMFRGERRGYCHIEVENSRLTASPRAQERQERWDLLLVDLLAHDPRQLRAPPRHSHLGRLGMSDRRDREAGSVFDYSRQTPIS